MASSKILYSMVFFLLYVTSTVNSCPSTDLAALLSIKSALHERHFGVFNSWKGNDCCNNWYGVNCDQVSKRVADINLRGDNPAYEKTGQSGLMTGSISPSICKLERLSSLTISDWKGISGQFLRIIDLVGNNLTGKIPRDIGRLHQLTVLNVGDNRISGQIPGSIVNLSSIMHLDLRNNLITGKLPRNLGSLQMLSRVLLSRNMLTGWIPVSISKMYRLADLDLSYNKLSGSIPTSLSRMSALSTLCLGSNEISGTIPPSLLTSSISDLDLSRNKLEGSIPDAFEAKSYFTLLDLSHNNLKGSIPKTTSNASYIGHLDLSHNHLCGRIPAGSPFDHLEVSMFAYNECLCGKPLKAC
ncbi:hypothetical protein ACFE04_006766 [Oxalis oulophora]